MTLVALGLLRGISLVALATVIGGLVLEWAALSVRIHELGTSRARLRSTITGCLVLLALATMAELVFRTQAMSRAPLATAVVQVPEVVARTHVGAVLAARTGMLVLGVLLSLTAWPALRALCLPIALGSALTMSLTGHAADWGDVTTSVAIDWAHAVAASVWTGGLFALALAVLPAHGRLPPAVLGLIGRRFSRIAGCCLLAVVATGIANAWTQLGTIARLWTTTYGQLLLLKVALVAVVASLGAVNRYHVLPRLAGGRAGRGVGARLFRVFRLLIRRPGRRLRMEAAPARLFRFVAGEAMVVLAIFACTAALGEVSPGRHTAFERRPASHITNITPSPRSGEAARIAGTVTTPPGDAIRGRAIFMRLRCFVCHAVPDDRMPTPSKPGPNLAGAARHHPGYLVESIVNPNAKIVDGPGYTDDRGLSTMPDYGAQMTVRDLVDLVAFLKSLDESADPGRPPSATPPPR